jgi:lipid-A-disaccharide synthase
MANNKILIIAGEPSGDRHAADLVYELKKQAPQLNFFGIGGEEMTSRGVHLFFHIRQMAFLGFAEVIRHMPFIQSVFKRLGEWLEKEKPAVVILVDYPGFNLRLARMVKKNKIPVVYYICPQLWAWGKKRIEKIRRYVDLPLVIFQFEEEFYSRYGIAAKFVGHPLVDEIHINSSEMTFRAKHHLDSGKPIIALLPGSRRNEVENLLPVMAQTAEKFETSEQYEWVVGKSATLPLDMVLQLLQDYPFIKIVEQDTHHLLKFAKVALVASGTATLETGYLGTPMVVLYKVAPLTYWMGRFLVTIKNIALSNIVLQKAVVPELIQNQVTPARIENELKRYLHDPEYYRMVAAELQKIPDILGKPGAAGRAATEILRFLRLT